MLLVKTYLAKSEISGNGIFAAEFIPKGTVIWEFTNFLDKTYSKHVVDNMPEDAVKSFLKKYAYLDADVGMPQYVLCVDDARFMNHSTSPNTSNGPKKEFEYFGTTIASRDIQIGEEITCDYFEIDDEAIEKLK